jgi:hypothetical protein
MEDYLARASELIGGDKRKRMQPDDVLQRQQWVVNSHDAVAHLRQLLTGTSTLAMNVSPIFAGRC